ncbi:unnamed protein product [Darwinula stevensoni]|uniref:Bcl-2 Bcl-2 homology region 1-3 domain-containing protein n=1 Tax=Darwinula stevensoni TaxID=69355 RepID=A0A7R8XH60_9CRUS|nr:unnamed protein product [Darwinula stevensoni]CAG0892444.1 unnamed protein product [Darwinula stevensoni]
MDASIARRTSHARFSVSRESVGIQRRFSVSFGEAGQTLSHVTRKLSSTIGWRSLGNREIANQARSLCSQIALLLIQTLPKIASILTYSSPFFIPPPPKYIRWRLKRSGINHRKLGLQRLRSVANLPGGLTLCQVFGALQTIGLELERNHPKLYSSVCRQVCATMTSEKVLRHTLTLLGRELFRGDVTWGKIGSLFAVTGSLAIDCVRQGHVEFLRPLVETVGNVIENEASIWILAQGGWLQHEVVLDIRANRTVNMD